MRIRAFIGVSVAVFVAVVLAGSALAQGRGTITGFVFGGERRPIERARVELLDDLNSVLKRVETDSSGRFVFLGVGSGRFQVHVLVPGTDFIEQTQNVEISGGASRGFETVQLDFRLRQRATSVSTPVVGVLYVQEVPEEAKAHFTAAIAALEKGQQAAGIEQLQLAIKAFPNYFLALERLGIEYMKKRQYDDARAMFAAAVAENSRSFNGWYGLSYANFGTDRFPESVAAAEKAIFADQGAAEAHFVLGLSLRKLKQYDKAERSFLRAKELDKGQTPEISWNLALLYAHNLQQYGKAADELEFFLKQTPDNPDAGNIKKLIANFRSKQARSK